MKRYLQETRFAASSLIEIIWSDFAKLEVIDAQLKVLTNEFEFKRQVFLANEFHPAANHYHAQAAQAYAGMSESKIEFENKVHGLTESIEAKSASISALSGAILQLAKQCISLRYGRPQNAPDGPDVDGISVKEIIWEGRNQSIHYENPKEISDGVVGLFKRLDASRNDGVVWNPRSQINFAFEVVSFLGWSTYENYERHMNLIGAKKGH